MDLPNSSTKKTFEKISAKEHLLFQKILEMAWQDVCKGNMEACVWFALVPFAYLDEFFPQYSYSIEHAFVQQLDKLEAGELKRVYDKIEYLARKRPSYEKKSGGD